MGMFEINSYGSVDVVKVAGRVDSSNAPELDSALKGLQDSNRYKFVIDLAQVDYMSSAGLRTLVSALRTSKKRSGDVRLARPSERVTEVLELAGLTSLFQIFNDQTAAVGSYT